MESMDDIEMLLPGLKVSSSLIRQQPLRRGGGPRADSQQGPGAQDCPRDSSRARGHAAAGHKGLSQGQGGAKAMKKAGGAKRRRPTETWALDLELCSGAGRDAKRFQGEEASGRGLSLSALASRRLLPPLQTEEASGGVLELMQAGITTSMRDELIESPRTAPPAHQPIDISAKPSSPSPTPPFPPATAAAAAASPHPASSADAPAPEDLPASPAPCDRISEGNEKGGAGVGGGRPPAAAAADAASLASYPDAMLSSCRLERYLSGMQDDMAAMAYPSSAPGRTAAEATLGESLRAGRGAPGADDLPGEYVKSKSAPPRMKSHLPCEAQEGRGSAAGGAPGGGEAEEGGARPVPTGSASGAQASEQGEGGAHTDNRTPLSSSSPAPTGAPPGSPPAFQKCALSRTEKWHERISIATLRLKARSLPCTPDRARNAHSLAAQ